jgi:hypothetical protein
MTAQSAFSRQMPYAHTDAETVTGTHRVQMIWCGMPSSIVTRTVTPATGSQYRAWRGDEECGGGSGSSHDERDERGTVPEQPPPDRGNGDDAKGFLRAEYRDGIGCSPLRWRPRARRAARRSGSHGMRIAPAGFGELVLTPQVPRHRLTAPGLPRKTARHHPESYFRAPHEQANSVTPARRSASAEAKASRQRDADGRPIPASRDS